MKERSKKSEEKSGYTPSARDPLRNPHRHCALTGLLNRKSGLRAAAAALRELPADKAAAVFLIDVDNLGPYNKRLGYLAGDALLVSVAHRLVSLFRESDLIVRVGGDEFLVLMTGTLSPEAVSLKARAICRIMEGSYRCRNTDYPLSVSVGAALSGPGAASRSILRQAKAALDSAKANGKNRFEFSGVSCADPETDPAPGQKPALGRITAQLAGILYEAEDSGENLYQATAYLAELLGADQALLPGLTGSAVRWPDHKQLILSEEQEIPAAAFHGEIFCCTAVGSLPLALRRAYAGEGVCATLQSLLPDGNRLRFDRLTNGRPKWDAYDIDLLLLASRLMGGRLRQLRSFAQLEQSCAENGRILSRLPVSVYVIERDSRRLLYFNDPAARRYPNVRLGIPCYQAFFARKAPCRSCPLPEQGEPFAEICRNSGLSRDCGVFSVSPLNWNGKTPAWLITAVEHIEGGGGQGLRYEMQQYSAALRAAFDSVLSVQPKTGQYTLFDSIVENGLPFRGNYDDTIRRFADQYVSPAHRERFLGTFLLNPMMEAFSAGEKRIELEYERIDHGEYRWKQRTAVLSSDGEERFIVSYVIDVTEKKRSEGRQEKLACISQALRGKWDGWALEIDVKTGRYVLLGHGCGDPDSIPPAGDYAESGGYFSDQRLHPEDRERIHGTLGLYPLLKAYYSGEKEVTERFRCLGKDNRYSWMESRACFMRSEDSPSILITTREITRQLEQERQALLGRQYDAALRKIYDELYELNFTQNSYRTVYHTTGKYDCPPAEGILSEEVRNISERIIHPADREKFLRLFDLESLRRAFSSGRDCVAGEIRNLWNDGAYHWASLTIFPAAGPEAGDETLLCFIMDITEKKRLVELERRNRFLERQRLDDERYRIILRQTGTLVFEYNHQTKARYYSPDFLARIAGRYDERDLLEIWLRDRVVYRDDLPLLERLIADTRSMHGNSTAALRLLYRDGRYRWSKILIAMVRDLDGAPKLTVGTVNDVDEQLRKCREIRRRAEFDELTGALNRHAFEQAAMHLLSEHPGGNYALIRTDLNHFKLVVDQLGAEKGDDMLRQFAHILREEAPDDAPLGRLNSDVFCLFTPYTAKSELEEYAVHVTRRLRSTEFSWRLFPSFGVCLVEDRAVPPSRLCYRAGVALKTVKGNTAQNLAYYDDRLRSLQRKEKKMEAEMEQALQNGQFQVYFQPNHDPHSSRVIGAEALVRWIHPEEGMIAPGIFIPLFERNGFIVKLNRAVLETVCQAIRSWIDRGLAPIPVSINISRTDAFHPAFADSFISICDRYQVPRKLILIEVAESVFAENQQELYREMNRLKDEGFRFSMNDFSAGYCPLNMLKDAPIDEIKLDRAFFDAAGNDSQRQAIVGHTIEMANVLALGIAAKGVDTREQAEFLAGVGCRSIQGFYYSHPMPLEEFERFAYPAAAMV